MKNRASLLLHIIVLACSVSIYVFSFPQPGPVYSHDFPSVKKPCIREFMLCARNDPVRITRRALVSSASLLPGVACGAMYSRDSSLSASSAPKDKTQEAKKRFIEGRNTVDELISNFDDISGGGGGDEIRRYLGTVGTTSSLFGIEKAFKILAEEADDIVQYTEAMNEFDRDLRGADSSAYSSMFVEFSAAKGKKEDFYDQALVDIKRMEEDLKIMGGEMGI